VCISKALTLHKKLVVLCCTPSQLFERRSRLYYYKIQDYSDPSNIQKDISSRKIDEITKTIEKVAWLPLEKIIGTVYENAKGYLDSEDFREAERFFSERMLWQDT